MKILIREGSSARNFEKLYPLIDRYPGSVMLCTDDYHPDDLMKGHIDRLIRRGLKAGLNFFNLYRAASLNPALHYRLGSGILRPGDPADFIVADRTGGFTVLATYINGAAVFSDGKVAAELPEPRQVNSFGAVPVAPSDLAILGGTGLYRVIRVFDGELVTGSETAQLSAAYGVVEPDLIHDILKIVVVNRYRPVKPSVAWIRGFGLKTGAIASSIAHDSHNVIGVGCSDREIADAVNLVIAHHGGIAVAGKDVAEILPLPVAGLMSTGDAQETGARYGELSDLARGLGSPLQAPFMALSFMSLLVIPHLKIGDRGLFNCDTFEFTDLKVE
jgi:adenine deaminase